MVICSPYAWTLHSLSVYSFSHSMDMVGAHQNLNCSRDISRLALAMINLPTKFEVSISTDYEDMKSKNVKNWVVWGS